MRRSKSNPAKYARNYRQISQRRMTEEEDQHIQVSSSTEIKTQVLKKQELAVNPDAAIVTNGKPKEQLLDLHALLSPELQAKHGGEDEEHDHNNNPYILPPRTKKNNKQDKRIVQLDALEIRQEQLLNKNQRRKLAQLDKYKQQKSKRVELYQKLEQSKITQTELNLLKSSSTRGAKETKKQTLRRLVQRERAGLDLTEVEHDLLYSTTTADTVDEEHAAATTYADDDSAQDHTSSRFKGKVIHVKEHEESQTLKKTTPPTTTEQQGITAEITDHQQQQHPKLAAGSFAQQLMENLHTLKQVAVDTTTIIRKRKEEDEAKEKHERMVKEDEESSKRVKYTPATPVVLKSAAPWCEESERAKQIVDKEKMNFKKGVVHVNRPKSVEESRFFLPVCEMEYEIISAVRSNDVVVLCAETGSGKSTQVPQFLYEAGFTGREDDNAMYNYDMGSSSSNNNRASHYGMIIGVTQPRRVAAVSTAKRVAFEMGCDIRSNGGGGKGNLVAYQTRYETAGMGSNTRIKFMTDGVLLQEIHSDLLLRKYSAICLDELHERNLNGDVLLGLLSSATLPLRRKAAEEGSLPPLKLIIMSATLRVEDFTSNNESNKRLFSSSPIVVKVPGRNFPVTVHHSKVTNLDDYETLAYDKVCKIHRSLPDGGILVFLTGRQEIDRMVKRLRKRFGSVCSSNTNNAQKGDGKKPENDNYKNDAVVAFREMDDEEIDGDLFQKDDDFGNICDGDDSCDDDDDIEMYGSQNSKPVHILPLYSMLSPEDQAKVFAPVPEGHRLIVVATNIAETSITIPDTKYVVDTGRQKSKNFHASTGIVSYDIMWISQAAADQRAGRAGRTGPGHCYRLYSSSVYSRHFDKFSTPEILTMPLEDVVLQMKAMNINDVGSFPFPTAPSPCQLKAALKVLCDIGLVDISKIDVTGGDGRITSLGRSVSRLPLNARFGKMLLVAAQANVLDYAIAIVAILSEVTPFLSISEKRNSSPLDNQLSDGDEQEEKTRTEQRIQWFHPHGDVIAALVAVGANSFAGRGAGGASEVASCKRFCDNNGLNFVVMQRIQKLRRQLAKLAKLRLNAKGVAAKTGGITYNMPPPNKSQENILSQSILSGSLDNVARVAPPGSISADISFPLANRAYFSCNPAITEPIFIDRNSFLFTRDVRNLPQFVCYGSLVRKPTKDGSTISCMTNVTCVDHSWLGILAEGSPLLSLVEPLASPSPVYDTNREAVMCSIATNYGHHGWCIPPVRRVMYDYLESFKGQSKILMKRDSFRWFARFLLEGKVIEELCNLPPLLNDSPAIITTRKPDAKVVVVVSALTNAGVDNGPALRKHWAEIDEHFLFRELKAWTEKKSAEEVKKLWINAVKQSTCRWRDEKSITQP